MTYHPSESFSVGMELELQLIDRRNQRLVDGILPLLERYPESPYVKPEFIQNTVEVASAPCENLEELAANMRLLVNDLLAACHSLDMDVCGAGTHPFYDRPASITPGPRYEEMERQSGWMSHNQVTFATHVHLGMPSGDEAMTLMHELKLYLPLLIALSANSPFWHGEDTGFAAFRQRVLASSRTYGIPPDFERWHDFEHFAATLQRAEILSSIHDIHWDIRPRPQLGTLEIRVMDAQPTLTEALALAALLRSVTRYLQRTRGEREAERPLSPIFWWSLKDNCYAASRLGIDAKFIVNNEGDVASILDLVDDVLERVAPHADCTERRYLDQLRERLPHGLPYLRQRRIHAEGGSLPQVVRTFVGDLVGEVA